MDARRLAAADPAFDCHAPANCSGLLPTLLVIGSRKSGTTALSNLLREHTHVVMPHCHGHQLRGMCVWDKEVRYFSRGARASICWYRSLYPCPMAATADAVEVQPMAFDGSPDYLVMPDAKVAAMGVQLGARARLIALLRNPTDRFYSAYNMGMNERIRQQGQKHQLAYANFAAELDRMIACAPECREFPSVVSMFFDYGLYARHITKYWRHFGRDRLLIERSEDFYANPWASARRIVEFAGLSMAEAHVAAMRRSAQEGLSDRARNVGGLWGGAAYQRKLRAAERRKLGAYFAPHNHELYALIGRDLGWERDNEAAIARDDQAPAAVVEQPTQINAPGATTADATDGGAPASRETLPLRPELRRA